jgi:hypothetical protein
MINPEFEQLLEQIFYSISRYGANKEFSKNEKPEDFDYNRFFISCNEGFKIGQSLCLEKIREIQKETSNLKEKLKDARREKKIELKKSLEKKIKTENYKEALLRNLIFSIVWQIFNGRREFISRFYTNEKGTNQLEGLGFEAILTAANDINKNSEKFALISDLTCNIQIGDLLVITQEQYEIIEIKTGKKNEEALRLIDFYKFNKIDITEERLDQTQNPKMVKQILRMIKQNIKTERVKTIIEEDSGEDPKLENTIIKLIDSPIESETYHDEIALLLKQLEEKDWAYTSIWGVLNVGVYKNDWRLYGKFALEKLNNGYPIFDLMGTLGVTISEPIFAKPLSFGDKNIINIATGKIKIYIGIDFDKFIAFSNDLGLPIRWSTRKEFGKFTSKSNLNNKEIFSHKNQGLIIEDEETKGSPIFVGYGMLFRMIYDHVSPETLVMNRIHGFEKFKTELKNKK